jgi:hypothetical protein
MKKPVAIGERRMDPRTAFGVAWAASFLGLVAILGLTFFVMWVLSVRS